MTKSTYPPWSTETNKPHHLHHTCLPSSDTLSEDSDPTNSIYNSLFLQNPTLEPSRNFFFSSHWENSIEIISTFLQILWVEGADSQTLVQDSGKERAVEAKLMSQLALYLLREIDYM